MIDLTKFPLSVLCAGNNHLQIDGTARLSVRTYLDMISSTKHFHSLHTSLQYYTRQIKSIMDDGG